MYGFDSFVGLPEDWREGFSKGMFKVKKLPKIKGVKNIMYPGENKFKRFKMNSKKDIKISETIKKDLKILKN